MVERRPPPALNRVFGALTDPTRREILLRLRGGPARISDLARRFPITFAAVSKHVGTLEQAGLITREVRGRDHFLSAHPQGLAAASAWIDEQRAFWETRLDRLADTLQPPP